MTQPAQPEYGRLIQEALAAMPLSRRKAAKEAGISDTRWGQIVRGYEHRGGHWIETARPAATIARMASVVGVTPDQLRRAGAEAAADALLLFRGMQAEAEAGLADSTLRRLFRIRDEVEALIKEHSNAQ